MANYTLQRFPSGPSDKHPKDPHNAVRGTLARVEYDPITEKILSSTEIAPTLENADFIIPQGLYRVVVTVSPKYGYLMPLLLGVKGRSGIRIHGGTKPGQSQGCVLITRKNDYQAFVQTLISQQNNLENITLEIFDYGTSRKQKEEHQLAHCRTVHHQTHHLRARTRREEPPTQTD